MTVEKIWDRDEFERGITALRQCVSERWGAVRTIKIVIPEDDCNVSLYTEFRNRIRKSKKLRDWHEESCGGTKCLARTYTFSEILDTKNKIIPHGSLAIHNILKLGNTIIAKVEEWNPRGIRR